MTTISEIDEQLARIENGEHPDYYGPKAFLDFFNRRKIRQLKEERHRLIRRDALWKGPDKPSCKGPSMFDLACSQIMSYGIALLLFSAIFTFILWYTGILSYILWIINAIIAIIGFFVSSLVNI